MARATASPAPTTALDAVHASDVPALAAGCAIFGTGGGGAVYTTQVAAERSLAEHGPVRLLIPEGGVSAIDMPSQPFHDPAADAALYRAKRAGRNQVVEAD